MTSVMIATPSSLDIIKAVQKYTGTPSSDLTSGDRSKSIVPSRDTLIYCLKAIRGMSNSEIGRALGYRNHTTIGKALDRFEERAGGAEQAAEIVQHVRQIAVRRLRVASVAVA